jgi:hypothetical protein
MRMPTSLLAVGAASSITALRSGNALPDGLARPGVVVGTRVTIEKDLPMLATPST